MLRLPAIRAHVPLRSDVTSAGTCVASRRRFLPKVCMASTQTSGPCASLPRVTKYQRSAVHGQGAAVPGQWFAPVFTMGVIIHQPTQPCRSSCGREACRSRKGVSAGEYFSSGTERIAYRGHRDALFRQDYGGLFAELFPELDLIDQGLLGRPERLGRGHIMAFRETLRQSPLRKHREPVDQSKSDRQTTSSNMRKVLFFDYWTRGVHHLLPIHNELQHLGVATVLLHVGSWRDKTVPTEEIISGVLCRDISWYKTRSVYKAIMKERPDVVLTLNSTLMMDRAVNASCRALGIPTVTVMHGLMAFGDELDDMVKAVDTTINSWRLARLGKYALNVLPNFWLALLRLDGFPALFQGPTWRYMIEHATNPAKATLKPVVPTMSMLSDVALVYADVYRTLFMEVYGYPEERIRIIGPPSLDPVFELRAEPPSRRETEGFLKHHGIVVPPGQQIATYLEGSFVEAGFRGWTIASRIKHLEEVVEACRAAGWALVIKLHPCTDASSIETAFPDQGGVFVRRTIDLPNLLWASSAALGHISTTIMSAVALRRPVLCPTFDQSQSMANWYLRSGVATECTQPGELTESLRSLDEIDSRQEGNRDDFIAQHITLVDGGANQRIVDSLLEVAITGPTGLPNRQCILEGAIAVLNRVRTRRSEVRRRV